MGSSDIWLYIPTHIDKRLLLKLEYALHLIYRFADCLAHHGRQVHPCRDRWSYLRGSEANPDQHRTAYTHLFVTPHRRSYCPYPKLSRSGHIVQAFPTEVEPILRSSKPQERPVQPPIHLHAQGGPEGRGCSVRQRLRSSHPQ